MATIYPLRGLRPRPELAAKIAAVPYDVVDRVEAKALAEGNPHSFLHVTKPEIDLPESVDPYDDRVYALGAAALRHMQDAGWLIEDREPCLYVYELTMGAHVQTGVVLCASVAEYEQNIVRKHEHTRPDKENDRVRNIEVTGAQTGVVFLCHRDSPGIAAEIQRATKAAPAYDFRAADGIRHRLWVVANKETIAKIAAGFGGLDVLYIADGHHRSAAAARVAAARRTAGKSSPDAACERFLAVSFPASQMQILPYNRVVKDLRGLAPEAFLRAVASVFDVTPGRPKASAPKQFGMYLAGAWHSLRVRPGTYRADDPVQRLDVSILQSQLLQPLLGIDDPRRDKRIDFVGGIRGEAELERRVRDGWAVAFSLHPTSIEDLFAIADAGQVMPPKSTWFEPKLRDGLVVHRI